MNEIESIKILTEKRSILFSTLHKQGPDSAFEYLEGYKKILGPKNYAGLKGELNFYDKYRKEYKLVVGADNGDHTDFSGVMGREMFRFDVTTNADYKRLKDYEPLQKEVDAKYKIVIMKDGDVDDIIDINFPFCDLCEEGRIMDIAFLLGENYNAKGEYQGSNDQVLVGACNYCGYAYEQERVTTGGLYDYSTEIANVYEYHTSNDNNEISLDVKKIILDHSLYSVQYLHRQFDKPIIAIGQGRYHVHSPDGEGDHVAEILWRDKYKIFDPYILDIYDFNPNYL